MTRWCVAAWLLVGVSGPAMAQTSAAQPPSAPAQRPATAPASPEETDQSDEPDIVVTGQRERGAVIGDIKPEQQLSPADIRSYGVNSVADLLSELAPETTSVRGRGGEAPVVLLNGRRISSFAEIRDLPTEAIARVDILPEEVALKYGYSADQKVVNFVLRRRFRAITAELAGRTATEGGGNQAEGSLDLLHIQGDGRFDLALKYTGTDALLESERGLTTIGTGRPFDLAGNIGALPFGATGEIDPALSAAAGHVVTSAGVPAGAATGTPTLAQFAGTAPNTTDLSPYRTLVPSSQDFSANATYSKTILDNVAATLNGRVELADSKTLLGLPSVSLDLPAGSPFSPFSQDVALYRYLGELQPLAQTNQSLTGHLGLTLNGQLSSWQWTFTGNFDHSDSRTITDIGIDPTALQAALFARNPGANPYAISPAYLTGLPANQGNSTSNSGGADLTATGSPFKLPAGDVSTTLRIGVSTSDLSSRSFRAGITQTGDVKRSIASGQVNVDVPVTSRDQGFLGAVGDISLNGNYEIRHLTDFGDLRTFGYGLNWKPIDAVQFIASVTDEDGAPSAQQLGNPVLLTPGVRVFDFTTGQSVVVTQLSGGNPGLLADNRHVEKLGLTVKPLSGRTSNLTLTANYVRSRTLNPIESLPFPTAAIEAAFPDRFVRDANGTLIRLDARPVNFASEERQDLRMGINFSRRLKSSLQKRFEAMRAAGAFPRRQGAGAPGGPGGGQRGAGGPGGGGFRGRGGGGDFGGRLQLAVYHTWHLQDDVLLRNGGPKLDLLHGDAIGQRGGQPQHEIEAQAGLSLDGFGARLSANWQSATTVRGATGSPTDTLHFGSLTTANLRLFANLGAQLGLVRDHPFFRGTRVTFSIDNLLDTRLHVTDANGVTPLSYQPAYLDPLGRTVRLSFRKLFF